VIPTEIRDPEKAPANVSSPLIYHWAECAIRDFAGEEYSAYGTSRQAPGVLLTGVGKKRTELKQGDVIVELNGKPIVSMNEMVRMLREAKEEKAASEELVLTVLRNQQRMTVRLPASLGLPVL
jgi:S1-C subfamily serine protease